MEHVYVRPKLYAKQAAAFFGTARYSWIEGSSKSGKTVSCMAWLFEQALFPSRMASPTIGWLDRRTSAPHRNEPGRIRLGEIMPNDSLAARSNLGAFVAVVELR